MRGSKQSNRNTLLAIIIVAIAVALAIFRFYYSAKYGEEFFTSAFRRIFFPTEKAQEVVDTELPLRLTVNPDYDGKNKEYIYSNSADTDAVVKILQTIRYEYYADDGSAIRTVETQSFNTKGKQLSSGYRRESCKMPDTSIDMQEVEITYQYDTDTIYRDYMIISYVGTDSVRSIVDSASESSEQNRT